jgi:hypothetical protein
VAILAGIQPLTGGALADARAATRPLAGISESLVGRITSGVDPAAQRAAAIEVASETIERLASFRGLRGLSISVDGDLDAAWKIFEKLGLGST